MEGGAYKPALGSLLVDTQRSHCYFPLLAHPGEEGAVCCRAALTLPGTHLKEHQASCRAGEPHCGPCLLPRSPNDHP